MDLARRAFPAPMRVLLFAWLALASSGCGVSRPVVEPASCPCAEAAATPAAPPAPVLAVATEHDAGAAAAPDSIAVLAVPPPRPPAVLRAVPSTTKRTLRLPVVSAADPRDDCTPHEWVTRELPAGIEPIDFAVRSLLRGPTPSERDRGLVSPFARSTSDPATPPLRADQLRVELRDGVATVSFEAGASPYLLQAICARTSVTSVIERTLLQFVEVREVVFAIGGVVIDEWDA